MTICFRQKQWCSLADKPNQRKQNAHETTNVAFLMLTAGMTQEFHEEICCRKKKNLQIKSLE